MEDLSDVLKKHFCGLYKKRGDVCTVKDRVIKMNEQRKTNRLNTAFEKRKIPENMSPVITPLPKREKPLPVKESVKKEQKEQPVNNKRLEMLAKWKAEKEKRKQLQKTNCKPVFKVSHIETSVGLPNLENVNKQIKGKPFKSKFAPPNHKFKPPANIKPIEFNNDSVNSKLLMSDGKQNKRKVKSAISEVSHRIVTRSQTRNFSATPSIVAHKADHKNNFKSKAKPKQKKAEDCEAPFKNKINQEAVSLNSVTTDSTESDTTSLMSPDYPVDLNSNSSENDIKTPKKVEPPVYVSPFVTISRGKDSARKEYEARKSRKSFSTKSDSIDCTSPKAGAAYFEYLLDNQIKRLQEVCDCWQKYKEEQDLPEEAVSVIDVAIGQTNLLLTKKFAQFRGLVDKCKQADAENPVRCEDLHGFWDMMHLQVDNVNKRFENLEKLRSNNWLEIVPEVKKVVKKKEKPVKNVKASAALREAIKAARRKKQTGNEEDKVHKSVEKKTPRKSTTNRLSVVKTAEKVNNLRNSSPGLMMMKIAQYAKSVETPGKSILKTDTIKSAKSHSKTVLFEDEVSLDADDGENDFNSTNVSKIKTPQRRSRRLTKSKLF